MTEKTKSTGVFIPGVTVETLKKVPIEAIKALLSEGELLDIDIEEIKKSACHRGLTQNNKWIPCSEELPSESGYYLATLKNSFETEVAIIWFAHIDDYGSKSEWREITDDDTVIAWAPLLEPYKESEEEQMQTFGFCVYHEIECDYKGLCIECPHNTKEDKEWFEEDERKELNNDKARSNKDTG